MSNANLVGSAKPSIEPLANRFAVDGEIAWWGCQAGEVKLLDLGLARLQSPEDRPLLIRRRSDLLKQRFNL